MQTYPKAALDAMDAGREVIIGLIRFDLGSGTYGFAKGPDPFPHGGITYQPSSVISVSELAMAPGTVAEGFTVELAASADDGLTPEVLSTIHDEDTRDRPVTVLDGRVGTMDCSIAPLTEPDMRTTHPALWIGPSKCQLKLGRYLRGVKFHPSGFQRYQSSCEPGNRIGPRHARTVGLVPNTPAAIRGTGGSPAARPHCQKMPEKEAGSLLLTHDDSSQPTADMSVEYTQSLDTLFRAEPEVRHPPVEVAAETRHTR